MTRIFALLLSLCLCGCIQQKEAKKADAPNTLTAEEINSLSSILMEAIVARESKKRNRGKFLLAPQTATLCDDLSKCTEALDRKGCDFLYSFYALDKALCYQLVSNNAISQQLAPPSGKTHVMSTEEFSETKFDKIFERDQELGGILQLTQPAISGDHKTALIYVVYYCGFWCRFGTIYVISKARGNWQVTNDYQFSAS